MILYHFTCFDVLSAIMDSGLSRGEVPFGPDREDCERAVNLTTSPSPFGHGVTTEQAPFSEHAYAKFAAQCRAQGFEPPVPREMMQWPDKSEIRITMKVPTTDRRLVKWSKYVNKRMEPSWREALERGNRPDTWWLYFGVIPASQFVRIEYKHDAEYRVECPYQDRGMRFATLDQIAAGAA